MQPAKTNLKILLFEWLTGGGLYFDDNPPDIHNVFLRQGTAMLEAMADDLDRAGHNLVIPTDNRLQLRVPSTAIRHRVDSQTDLRSALRWLANDCDHVLLIAPECEGCLIRCCDWLEDFADRFISPNWEFVRLASCKQTTAEHLAAVSISVPAGRLLNSQEDLRQFDFPFVAKPLDGAGSDGVFLAACREDRVMLEKRIWQTEVESETSKDRDPHPGPLPEGEGASAVQGREPNRTQHRIESFVAGQPVSVSVLSGPGDVELLPATGQLFDRQPIGVHIGSAWPLPDEIASRARNLASATVNALPGTRGYFGIDMVIADAGPDADAVIEVNPRLTTSYLKLREILPFNVAQRMVQLAADF